MYKISMIVVMTFGMLSAQALADNDFGLASKRPIPTRMDGSRPGNFAPSTGN